MQEVIQSLDPTEILMLAKPDEKEVPQTPASVSPIDHPAILTPTKHGDGLQANPNRGVNSQLVFRHRSTELSALGMENGWLSGVEDLSALFTGRIQSRDSKVWLSCMARAEGGMRVHNVTEPPPASLFLDIPACYPHP